MNQMEEDQKKRAMEWIRSRATDEEIRGMTVFRNILVHELEKDDVLRLLFHSIKTTEKLRESHKADLEFMREISG